MDVEMKIQEYAHRHMSMRVQSLLLENKELINQLTKQKLENERLENFIKNSIRRENSEL